MVALVNLLTVYLCLVHGLTLVHVHILAVCSHRRAYYYYEEAIKKGKGFTGVPCDSWEDFKAGKCKDDSQKTIQLANDSKNPK